MPAFIDLSNQKYGRLTVVKRIGINNDKRPLWLCRCECGNETNVSSKELRNGDTKSCGCYQREQTAKAHTKHGHYYDRLYRVWIQMKQRCLNPDDKDYANYGGRGITINPAWNTNYMAFRDWAILSGYDPDAPFSKCTLDRINVNGNYEPSNCRWADSSTQSKNRRPWKKKGNKYVS